MKCDDYKICIPCIHEYISFILVITHSSHFSPKTSFYQKIGQVIDCRKHSRQSFRFPLCFPSYLKDVFLGLWVARYSPKFYDSKKAIKTYIKLYQSLTIISTNISWHKDKNNSHGYDIVTAQHSKRFSPRPH